MQSYTHLVIVTALHGGKSSVELVSKLRGYRTSKAKLKSALALLLFSTKFYALGRRKECGRWTFPRDGLEMGLNW